MSRRRLSVTAVLIVRIAGLFLAKGVTTKIVIEGPALATPEIDRIRADARALLA